MEVGLGYILPVPVPGDVIFPAKLYSDLYHNLSKQHHQLVIIVSNMVDLSYSNHHIM